MELPIFAVLLASVILSVGSHPKNSDVLPKDYYKRQILQPIPGYIPVYIKADGVPIVRTESKKHALDVTPGKVTAPKEKNLQTEAENSPQTRDKKSDEVKSESSAVPESKNPGPVTLEEKTEPKPGDQERNEKLVENPHVKVVDLKS